MAKVILPVEKKEILKKLISPETSSAIITNQSCVDSCNAFILPRLKEELKLKKVFTPEHGLLGNAAGGEKVLSYFDRDLGLEIISLYGENYKPLPEHLKDIQVVFYHVQDLGLRFYTYISTLFNFMEVLHEQKSNVKLVILDRPNPLGRAVEGPMLDNEFKSFVGMVPVPIRYGLTPGELALYIKDKFKFKINLSVIAMDNYEISEYSGWPPEIPWNPPSSAIKDIETAFLYSGLCLLEGTNLSEGRGTEYPFKLIGKPNLETKAVIDYFKNKDYPVHLESVKFIPAFSKFKGEECSGIKIELKSTLEFNGIQFTSHLLHIAKPVFSDFFDKLAGTDKLRTTIQNINIEKILPQLLHQETQEYKKEREKFFLY